MAVYGVLGDIHGNVEALEAVLAALDVGGVRRLLCVGDVVGYNADPDACIALLRARGTQVIAGNHDLIGTGRLGFERCSNKARYSLQRTRRRLAAESIAWLNALPPNRLIEGAIALVHGGVRDVQLYMTTPQHIHDQKLYEVAGDEVRELPNEGLYHLSRDRVYFINAGSVDAQRKREHKLAEFAIIDSDAWTVQFFSVRYDAASTEAKATVAGYRIGPLTDWIYTLRRRLQFI